MIEETSGASAPGPLSSSESTAQASSLVTSPVESPSASDPGELLNRLVKLEGEVFPRLQALEEALVSLANRAASDISPVLSKELSELKTVVHSLGGGVFGLTGHDAASLFHTWWKKLTQGDQSVASSPAPAPASDPTAGGAPIPLRPSTK
jgi:hypothetical protein